VQDLQHITCIICEIQFVATGGGRHCDFVKILQRSIAPEQTTPAWCDKCEKYQPTFQSRVPKALPPILSLNSCLDNSNVIECTFYYECFTLF